MTFAAVLLASIVFVVAMCAHVSCAISADGFDPACLVKLQASDGFDVACLVKLQASPPVSQAKPKATVWCIDNCPPCRTQEGIVATIKDVTVTVRKYDPTTAPAHIKEAVALRKGFPMVDVVGKPLRSGVMSAKDLVAFASK